MQMRFCWDRRSPAHAPENHIAINGTVVVSCHLGLSSPGKTTTLRLFSSTQMDPSTLFLFTTQPSTLACLLVVLIEFQFN